MSANVIERLNERIRELDLSADNSTLEQTGEELEALFVEIKATERNELAEAISEAAEEAEDVDTQLTGLENRLGLLLTLLENTRTTINNKLQLLDVATEANRHEKLKRIKTVLQNIGDTLQQRFNIAQNGQPASNVDQAAEFGSGTVADILRNSADRWELARQNVSRTPGLGWIVAGTAAAGFGLYYVAKRVVGRADGKPPGLFRRMALAGIAGALLLLGTPMAVNAYAARLDEQEEKSAADKKAAEEKAAADKKTKAEADTDD